MATTQELLSLYAVLYACMTDSGDGQVISDAIDMELGYQRCRASGASTSEAMLDVLHVRCSAADPETGGPAFEPIRVPEACVPHREALLRALAETQALQAQAREGEAAAGWDATP